ncbi:MAG TPA: hypothetical protein VGL91_11915 [Acidobacteriota bacterium]|jgi:uncharacterized protein (DUF433 family)
MGTVQKSLRIPPETLREIEQLAAEAGIDFSTAANQLLEEAVRMRRCPGIVFTSGPSGRRATLSGTGLDVSEVIAAYKGLGKNINRLDRAYHWLSEAQLRSALTYYSLYPRDINARLKRNEAWTSSSLRKRYPALTSPPR